MLIVMSTLCEAKLYRVLVDRINVRVGRYFLFMILFNAGMWNAAPGVSVGLLVRMCLSLSLAFLPSSFAMYANTLAFAYAVEPSSSTNHRRTYMATTTFAAGAIVGWPFALVVAVPFVFEELFMRGIDRVPANAYVSWMLQRWQRLVMAGAVAALIFVSYRLDSCSFTNAVSGPCGCHRFSLLWAVDHHAMEHRQV
jgi:alpha-1,2-mannosyltransferase